LFWLREHEGDGWKLEISLNPELQEIIEMASHNSTGLHGEVNDRFRPNTWEDSE
jgi:hypothetical protein